MSVQDPTQNMAHYFLDQRVVDGMGDRVAVRTQDRNYAYREVQQRAHRYGSVLLAHGVRSEERVLVALSDDIDMVAAIFGILEIGAVVVMVNPGLDESMFAYFLEYTRARVVVTSEATVPQLSAPAAKSPHLEHILVVDQAEFLEQLEEAADRVETFPSHPDDPAIWLFSGGTTGHPKAVVQSHNSFRNTTECYAQHVLGYTPDDITVSVPKLYFGYATGSNLLFPFSVGASTVLFPERCTSERLFEAIEQHQPTILINVPTMIGKLLDDKGAASRDLSSLRVTTSAGEALPEELYRRWKKRFGTEILDGLGTAEMWHIFLSNHLGDVRPGSLGRAVEGFDVEVRDDAGDPVPEGEVGWLWVRGDSRAQGYWQQPEKTKKTFRGEWVVTGDMVRCDSGYFSYCGRGDDMVKVSGKWLAPGEVEGCLMEHPAVREAAVIAVENQDGLSKPWAFVLTDDAVADADEFETGLREFVLERLEPYKAPRRVVRLTEFPRTHLGKVDRGALRRDHAPR